MVNRLTVAAIAIFSLSAASAKEDGIADAAMRGDTAAVRTLLKGGADVNAAQGDGMTALHWAAQSGNITETQMLIFAGARLEATTRNGSYTPLHLAAKAGRAGTVKALIQAGANVSTATASGGATALHFAANQGNIEAIAALLDKGASVDTKDSAFAQTPLMWAAAAGRTAAVELLTKRGASVKLMSKVENVPLKDSLDRMALQARTRRIAALKAADNPPAAAKPAPKPAAKLDSMKKDSAAPARGGPPAGTDSAQNRVINRGPSYSDLIGNKGGLTPLLFAIREGHTESVVALLKAGSDVNQVSGGDHTSPLLMATINGHFDIAKMLLEKGADPKLASDAGTTPLYATINIQWAPKSMYPQPTAQTRQTTTHLELMEMLLKKGADVNAKLSKHLWFMSYNFDLLGVNTTGATPFWRAAYGLDIPAMRLLMKYGADPTTPTTKPIGRLPGADPAGPETANTGKGDPSGLPPVPDNGPGVYPIHAASGVGYGEGFAANSHMHAPDAWIPAVKYLIEELHADVNARDFNGYTPLHHAAARGDNDMMQYLVSKGGDIHAVSRKGETVADMANGPVQRIPPFPETVAFAEKLGSKNSHKCKSC
ncbi:MAG TPA: ankyrin repeat domain-containing protein [Gemmatimonadaceae bacterium]|jgi:ankyrin repeat protein